MVYILQWQAPPDFRASELVIGLGRGVRQQRMSWRGFQRTAEVTLGITAAQPPGNL